MPKVATNDDELMMVMGADVTHPAPTGDNREVNKSVASVIASITPDLMRYVAIVRQQNTTLHKDKATREVIDAMDVITRDLLTVFSEKNRRLPTKLIFYRDGVSEGQFQTVLMEELLAIQKACYAVQQGYEPGITFIVVQKRHHIRFKPTDLKARNVNAGTVVDTQITHKREHDFYLCSHEGIQGTSKPVHYHMLYDDNDWAADDLQLFTYYLCHAYMRCCRSVSYPAPTFYAHLAAFRARDWLKDSGPNDQLLDELNRFRLNTDQRNRMFFL
uniref:Piwi domain-containing protein n=1 Tax=Mesocestoides corti TaxID=53468 RepID=A0A5K3FSX6_MESCO